MHKLTWKLSRTNYPLHLWTDNSSFSDSSHHSAFSSSHLLSPVETLDQEEGLSHSQHLIFCAALSMDKVFLEESQTRLYSHSAEIMEAREGGQHRTSLCPTLKMNAKGVLIPCVPPTLSQWVVKEKTPVPEWKKICLHTSLIHSQPNTHHLLQATVHTIKGFIFVLNYLSIIM